MFMGRLMLIFLAVWFAGNWALASAWLLLVRGLQLLFGTA